MYTFKKSQTEMWPIYFTEILNNAKALFTLHNIYIYKDLLMLFLIIKQAP